MTCPAPTLQSHPHVWHSFLRSWKAVGGKFKFSLNFTSFSPRDKQGHRFSSMSLIHFRVHQSFSPADVAVQLIKTRGGANRLLNSPVSVGWKLLCLFAPQGCRNLVRYWSISFTSWCTLGRCARRREPATSVPESRTGTFVWSETFRQKWKL